MSVEDVRVLYSVRTCVCSIVCRSECSVLVSADGVGIPQMATAGGVGPFPAVWQALCTQIAERWGA